MAQRLKRWESPRREGRNDKGKGGSARQRQRRKQFQRLRQRLKEQPSQSSHPSNYQTATGEASRFPSFVFILGRAAIAGLDTWEEADRKRMGKDRTSHHCLILAGCDRANASQNP